MTLSAWKKEISLGNMFTTLFFFAAAAFIFNAYSIDYSPLFIALILIAYARYIKKIENLPPYLDVYLLGSLAILISLVTTVFFKISGYGIAAIGFAILVTVLFENLEFSLLFSFFISAMAASIEGGNYGVGVSLFTGSLIAAKLSFRIRHRSQLMKAGLIGGVVQFLTAFILNKEQSFLFFPAIDIHLLQICLLNGLISAIVVLGILPLFEYVFRVVTNISLLELSDSNHPLLRRLILEAPGTYSHSLVVANLSEAAADAVGANSLLARVGAYYHDVGKMLKPNYFVENLVGYRDVHKDLKPSMSKIIIMNHVKDGIELGRQYHLNSRIIDFIEQHHGKTLVYYFYQKAKELDPEKEHEEDYRYLGPKPQSKEVVIVALADSIEALSRTLDEPTPARIEETVRGVVRKRFLEGELDESNLTLNDLEKITQSFIRMLNALFHSRITYPKDSNP
ncbi:MAG: HDIG domain-containing metalloprotein [Candidatus Omnitrophota bacterium]|nr:HDIG domain-containing protein [Candidatus Omnitrophota bacterium]